MSVSAFKMYLIQRGLHKTTRKNYLVALGAYFKTNESFTESSVRDFLLVKHQTISPSGVNKYIKAFRQYCAYSQIKPFNFLSRVKERPMARVMLSDDEIEALAGLETDRYDVGKFKTFWTTLAFTGARPQEICVLEPKHIDQGNHVLYIDQSKTGVARTVPILEPLRAVLYPYVAQLRRPFLFSSYQSNSTLTHTAYMKDWKKRLALLGIEKDVKPYSLRHSFITNTLGQGANLYSIQDVVGHSDPTTTRRYYHGNIDLMRKAAEKLPLAKKQADPKVLVDQMSDLIDEFLKKDERFDEMEILEAKKHLYKAIKKD